MKRVNLVVIMVPSVLAFSSLSVRKPTTRTLKKLDAARSRDDDADDPDMARIRERARQIIMDESADAREREANAAAGGLTGAVVGTILGGPLGLLLGWSAGSSIGASSRSPSAKLRQLGVDLDLLRAAEEMAREVEAAQASVLTAESSLASTRRYEDTLSRDRDASQQAAEDAVRNGDDDAARRHLSARMSLDSRVNQANLETQDAEQRLSRAKSDVDFLQRRLRDLEDMTARAIVVAVDGASAARVRRDDVGLMEDPLVERFRALEQKRE